jgi:hypothetical protein
MLQSKRWWPFLILTVAAAIMQLLWSPNPDVVEKQASVALTPVEVMVTAITLLLVPVLIVLFERRGEFQLIPFSTSDS